MSLQQDILPYIDGDGLVSNAPVPAGVMRASDNGVLFTSQYIILADKVGDDTYLLSLNKCISNQGYLERAPGDASQDAPDDYIGASAIGMNLNLPLAVCQPAIVYMQALIRGFFPIRAISPLIALIIALSNIFEAKSNTSNKLLTWTLIKGLEDKSLLCRLGGMIWTLRMKLIYGSTKAIASIYFGESHPFIKYWKE